MLKGRSGLRWSPPPAVRAWQAFKESQMSEWTATDSRWDLELLSSGLLNLSLTFHQQRYQHWHPQLKFITWECYGVKNITIGQLQIRHNYRSREGKIPTLSGLGSSALLHPGAQTKALSEPGHCLPSWRCFLRVTLLVPQARLSWAILCHSGEQLELVVLVQLQLTDSPPSLQTLKQTWFTRSAEFPSSYKPLCTYVRHLKRYIIRNDTRKAILQDA